MNYDDSMKEAAHLLMRHLNVFSFNNEAFAKAICNDHRTLQQSAMRAFLACIQQWKEAHDEGRYDMRNEATVRLAKKMLEAVDEKDLYLPMI